MADKDKEIERLKKHIVQIEKEFNDKEKQLLIKQQQLLDKEEELTEVKDQSKPNIDKLRFEQMCEEVSSLRQVVFQRPTTTKSRSMNNSQPLFSGKKDENILNWLQITVTNMTVAKIEEDEKVLVASTYLREGALQVYTAMIKTTTNQRWLQFTAELKKAYMPANYETLLIRKLNKFKMTKSLQEYITEFNYMVNQTEDISEGQKVFMFSSNVRDDIDQYLLLMDPKTLKEAQVIALQFEASRSLKDNPIALTYVERNNYKLCSFCQKKGHTRDECFKIRDNNESRNANRSNSNRYQRNDKQYQEARHSNNSYTGANNTDNKERSNQFRNFRKYDNKNTYKSKWSPPNKETQRPNSNDTNQQDHATRAIEIIKPEPTLEHLNKNESQKVATAVHVNNTVYTPGNNQSKGIALINNQEIEVIFDTGATESVMPFEMVKRYNIPYKDTDIWCNMGSGHNIKVLGITEKLNVMVYGSHCILQFMIFDRRNCLLGFDWFKATESAVFAHNQTLVFGKRIVYLDVDTDQIESCLLTEIADQEPIDETLDTIDDKGSKDDDLQWTFTSIEDTTVDLEDEIKEDFNTLTTEFKDIFATSLADLKVPANAGTFEINTTTEVPIYRYPYRKSISERNIINAEVDKMLKAGVIQPYTSPWSSPVVMIPKDDGTLRFCIDYRELNKITIPDPYPMPRIDDIFDRLQGSKYFTKLDMKSGYWQILMFLMHVSKTAFSTADGHYEFLRLPFGVKNGTRGFSRIMSNILGDLKFVEIYLDDITVHSKNIRQHLIDLRKVFKRLRKFGVKLNTGKCSWFKKEIKLLGHLISENYIRMNPEKIEAIRRWITPFKLLHIQQFLGICNYYRRFILNFARIAAPLYNLLKKEIKFAFDQQCIEAFEALKLALTSYPVLRQPDLTKMFYLHTDASGLAIGAILAQLDDQNQEYVVAYASRLFKGAEIHYGITEKECLALLWAVKYFRVYITGVHFKAITDHKALQWLMSIKEPTGRLARWAIYLQSFDFEIIHRAGKKHINADAISRSLYYIELDLQENNKTSTIAQDIDYPNFAQCCLAIQDDTHTEDRFIDISSKHLDIWEDSNLLHFLKTGKFFSGSSKRQIKRIVHSSDRFLLGEDSIWYLPDLMDKSIMLEVPKIADRIPLIKSVHLLGHFKIQTTYNRLKNKYYWRNMIKDIEHYVNHCVICLKHDFSTVKNHSALAIPITGIFDRIGVDLVFGLPETIDGFKGILIITEFLTKFPYAVPIKSKSADEIASQLWQYFSIFGPTKQMLSDQGKEFMNTIILKLLESIGTEHTVTSPYHPQCNGMTEKLNSTLISTIRKHTDNDPLNWNKWLPYCLLAYRSRVHSTTKFTPFELMFGRPMNLFVDNRIPGSTANIELLNRLAEIQLLFENDVPQALENIQESQAIQIENQNKRQHLQVDIIPKGTEVYIKNLMLQNKLLPEYNGPYYVNGNTKLGNYWLIDKLGSKLKDSLPLSRLKIVDKAEASFKIQPKQIENTIEPIFYIENIIKERTKAKSREFLVKWIDYPESENSWVKQKDILDPQLIINYDADKKLQSINRAKNLAQHRPKNIARKEKSFINYTQKLHPHFPNNYLILTIILILSSSIRAFLVSESFQYCQGLSSSRILDINGICNVKPASMKPFLYPQKNAQLAILSLKHNKINGMGVECKMEKINIILTTNWINYPYRSQLTELIHLTKEDCQYMVATQRCDGRKMICDNTVCTINYMPDETNRHKYRDEVKLHGIRCSFQPKLIIAEDISDTLFGQGKSACKVTDFGCILQDSTIVWDKKIIHFCPYEVVTKGKFDINSDNTVFSDSSRMLLKVTGFIKECSMKLYTTTEGLFIIGENYTSMESLKLGNNKEIQTINEIILTDQDYAVHQLLELHKQWIVRSCIQLKNILSLHTIHMNTS